MFWVILSGADAFEWGRDLTLNAETMTCDLMLKSKTMTCDLIFTLALLSSFLCKTYFTIH
jgi:hypothetical protein